MNAPNRTLVSALTLTVGFMASRTADGAIVASLLDEDTDIVNTGGGVHSAVHFQNVTTGSGATDPNPLVINGIAHIGGSNNEPLLTDNFTFEGDFRNGASGLPQDGSSNIQILLSGIAGASSITMSVGGLTPGTEYLFQAYWEAENNASLGMNIEGATLGGLFDFSNENATDPDGGTLISYQFVAGDDTLNATFDRDDGGGNNWLSGYSLQVVPEPSSLALLGLGGLLVARRRRG